VTRRILHLIDQTGPGGAQTIYLDLISRLNATRWTSCAAVPGPGWVADALRKRGHEPIFTPLTGGAFDWRYLRTIIGLIRSQHIDLIQSHLLGPAVYGAMAALACRVPQVATFHGQSDVSPHERFRWLKFALLGWAAGRVTFVSEALRRHFVSVTSLKASVTGVIPNGVDFAALDPPGGPSLRRSFGAGDGQVLVGAIGHLRPQKDYDTFLRTARLLANWDPAYRFVIVGQSDTPGYQEQLLERRRTLGLEHLVQFAGGREDVGAVLRAFDVYLLTSISEGFSLSLVQAQACGVPAVATRCGGPEEIMRDGETGMLAAVADAEGLAAAVERVRRGSLREAVTRAARDLVRARYEIGAMISQYDALYADCLRH